MVKLAVTITAAMAAAAVLADIGFAQPDSPLAPRQPSPRQGASGGSDITFGSTGREADMSPPHDFSSSMDAGHAGNFREAHYPPAHHPPSPEAGSLGGSVDAGHEVSGRWHGSGRLDGRFPPPPDAGSHDVPPFPDRDQFSKTHRKALENDKPYDRNPQSPRTQDAHVPHNHGRDGSEMGSGSLWSGSDSVDGHFPTPPEAGRDDTPPSPRRERDAAHREALQNDGNSPPPSSQGDSNAKQETPGQDQDHGKLQKDGKPVDPDEDVKPDDSIYPVTSPDRGEQMPSAPMGNGDQRGRPTGDDKSSRDNEPNEDSKPDGGSKALGDSKPFGDGLQPGGDNKIDSDQHKPSTRPNEHENVSNRRDNGDRAHLNGERHPKDRGSWHDSDSVDGQFPPPPNAGSSNEHTPAVGGGDRGENGVKAPTNGDKAGGGNSPPSRVGNGSGSHFYSPDVGTGTNDVPRTGDKQQ